MNTDGSSSAKHKYAACGGVLRDEKANFLGAFSHRIGMSGPLEAELWGIYDGLKQA